MAGKVYLFFPVDRIEQIEKALPKIEGVKLERKSSVLLLFHIL